MQKRKRYSKEFKREAVQMTKGTALSLRQVAAELGLHPTVLSRWCREQEQAGEQAFHGPRVSREEEVAHLKRELARVTRERDFLKEMAAFFAQEALRTRP